MMTPRQFAAHYGRIKEGLRGAVRLGLLQAAYRVQAEIKEQVRMLFAPKTGDLSASFDVSLAKGQGKDDVAAKVVSTLVYAGIQDTGGTIYPRRGKALAIALRRNDPRWPRDFPRGYLRLIESKKGNLLLAHVRKSRGKDIIDPHFLLRSSVTIKGKRYLDKSWNAAKADVYAIIGDHVMRLATKGDG